MYVQGLKTSEEMTQEEMLRQAWDAPGSPFAGQPFNPGAVNWGGGGGGDGGGPQFPAGMPGTAAQGPEDLARLQAVQEKRLSRVESLSGNAESEQHTDDR
jgi:hypothetical protein